MRISDWSSDVCSSDLTDYIKRIVGLPGDKTEVREGILHINDVPVQRELLSASEMAAIGYTDPVRLLYYETLPTGHPHRFRELGDQRTIPHWETEGVRGGHCVDMGDTRSTSRERRQHGETVTANIH